MGKRLTTVLAAAVMFTTLAAAPAFAHPVGEPGTPTCFGERISHGSASATADGHELTPVERAAALSDFVVNVVLQGGLGPDFQAFAEEFFGTDGVDVRETMRWIRLNCSDDPVAEA